LGFFIPRSIVRRKWQWRTKLNKLWYNLYSIPKQLLNCNLNRNAIFKINKLKNHNKNQNHKIYNCQKQYKLLNKKHYRIVFKVIGKDSSYRFLFSKIWFSLKAWFFILVKNTGRLWQCTLRVYFFTKTQGKKFRSIQNVRTKCAILTY